MSLHTKYHKRLKLALDLCQTALRPRSFELLGLRFTPRFHLLSQFPHHITLMSDLTTFLTSCPHSALYLALSAQCESMIELPTVSFHDMNDNVRSTVHLWWARDGLLRCSDNSYNKHNKFFSSTKLAANHMGRTNCHGPHVHSGHPCHSSGPSQDLLTIVHLFSELPSGLLSQSLTSCLSVDLFQHTNKSAFLQIGGTTISLYGDCLHPSCHSQYDSHHLYPRTTAATQKNKFMQFLVTVSQITLERLRSTTHVVPPCHRVSQV